MVLARVIYEIHRAYCQQTAKQVFPWVFFLAPIALWMMRAKWGEGKKSFFALVSISAQSNLANRTKPHGNACYAGYIASYDRQLITLKASFHDEEQFSLRCILYSLFRPGSISSVNVRSLRRCMVAEKSLQRFIHATCKKTYFKIKKTCTFDLGDCQTFIELTSQNHSVAVSISMKLITAK